jgi:hypothetical protein
VKLRAQIVIELEAIDYKDAARHQSSLEDALNVVRRSFGDARLILKTRRERVAGASAGMLARSPSRSGLLAEYVDD